MPRFARYDLFKSGSIGWSNGWTHGRLTRGARLIKSHKIAIAIRILFSCCCRLFRRIIFTTKYADNANTINAISIVMYPRYLFEANIWAKVLTNKSDINKMC